MMEWIFKESGSCYFTRVYSVIDDWHVLICEKHFYYLKTILLRFLGSFYNIVVAIIKINRIACFKLKLDIYPKSTKSEQKNKTKFHMNKLLLKFHIIIYYSENGNNDSNKTRRLFWWFYLRKKFTQQFELFACLWMCQTQQTFNFLLKYLILSIVSCSKLM